MQSLPLATKYLIVSVSDRYKIRDVTLRHNSLCYCAVGCSTLWGTRSPCGLTKQRTTRGSRPSTPSQTSSTRRSAGRHTGTLIRSYVEPSKNSTKLVELRFKNVGKFLTAINRSSLNVVECRYGPCFVRIMYGFQKLYEYIIPKYLCLEILMHAKISSFYLMRLDPGPSFCERTVFLRV